MARPTYFGGLSPNFGGPSYIPDRPRSTPACEWCEASSDTDPRRICGCSTPHWTCRDCWIQCRDCFMQTCPDRMVTCTICDCYVCPSCDRGVEGRTLCRGCAIKCTCTGCDGRVIGEHASACPGCPMMVSTCDQHLGTLCRECGCLCQACGAVFTRTALDLDARADPPADGVNCWPTAAACPECQRAARAWRRLTTRDALVQWTPLNAELAEKVATGMYRSPGDPVAAPAFPSTSTAEVRAVMDSMLQTLS